MSDSTDVADGNVRLRVNGEMAEFVDLDPNESLLSVLRERLGLYGTKNACEQGECGSCSVLLDGALVCSCLVAATDAHDSDVTTVEGFSPTGEMSDVQRALLEAGAIQCGFCTPGIVVALEHLLEQESEPLTEGHLREFLSGNLCRCTGYGRILAGARQILVDAGIMMSPLTNEE